MIGYMFIETGRKEPLDEEEVADGEADGMCIVSHT